MFPDSSGRHKGEERPGAAYQAVNAGRSRPAKHAARKRCRTTEQRADECSSPYVSAGFLSCEFAGERAPEAPDRHADK